MKRVTEMFDNFETDQKEGSPDLFLVGCRNQKTWSECRTKDKSREGEYVS